MELSDLKSSIIDRYKGSPVDLEQILALVDEDQSVFPFNEYEHLITRLIDTKGLSFADYLNLREDYIRANPNLWIFEISSPRGFGEGFAQTYVKGLCDELQDPSRKIDPQYTGQYDFWLNNIKIEVKASRVVNSSSNEPLYMKALASNTHQPFNMNFQQLKPNCCDVFIWIAVFRDKILTWVINAKTVAQHPLYSKGQHRGNSGNEGQLHITENNIRLFDQFLLGSRSLKQAILEEISPSRYTEIIES
jgi:hypothetical protein